jgi:hypothetical protein
MPKNKIYFLIFFDNVKKNNDIWHSLIEYPVGSRLPQTGRNPATKGKYRSPFKRGQEYRIQFFIAI